MPTQAHCDQVYSVHAFRRLEESANQNWARPVWRMLRKRFNASLSRGPLRRALEVSVHFDYLSGSGRNATSVQQTVDTYSAGRGAAYFLTCLVPPAKPILIIEPWCLQYPLYLSPLQRQCPPRRAHGAWWHDRTRFSAIGQASACRPHCQEASLQRGHRQRMLSVWPSGWLASLLGRNGTCRQCCDRPKRGLHCIAVLTTEYLKQILGGTYMLKGPAHLWPETDYSSRWRNR